MRQTPTLPATMSGKRISCYIRSPAKYMFSLGHTPASISTRHGWTVQPSREVFLHKPPIGDIRLTAVCWHPDRPINPDAALDLYFPNDDIYVASCESLFLDYRHTTAPRIIRSTLFLKACHIQHAGSIAALMGHSSEAMQLLLSTTGQFTFQTIQPAPEYLLTSILLYKATP